MSPSPSAWRCHRLGELAQVQKGRLARTTIVPAAGAIPYLDVSSFEGPPSRFTNDVGLVLANSGDILMVWDGERSGLVCRGTHGAVGSTIARLRPNNLVVRGFLFHSLRRQFDFIQGRRTGTGVPHVPRDLTKMLELSLPADLKEQCRITEVLDTLDDAIRRTEQIIVKLQQVKQGFLHDLLTRGVDENGELRDPEGHPEQFRETLCGKVPARWEATLVSEEFEVSSGITLGPHRVPTTSPWPYLRVANVQRERLDLSDIAFLQAKPAELVGRTLLAGDLLVVEGHANPAEIGRCAMTARRAEGFAFQNHLFRLRPRRLLSGYALLWMNSLYAQQYWRRVAVTSSGLYTINQRKLQGMGVVVPPVREQAAIVDLADGLSSRLALEKAEEDKLRVVRHGLMDDFLTGRVRVPEAEQALL